jgi:hypothetical protein
VKANRRWAGGNEAEQQQEASVFHPKWIPGVTDESENKREIEGNGGE